MAHIICAGRNEKITIINGKTIDMNTIRYLIAFLSESEQYGDEWTEEIECLYNVMAICQMLPNDNYMRYYFANEFYTHKIGEGEDE